MTTLASISFLPWLRQGVAARIPDIDTLALGDGTAIERSVMQGELRLQYKGQDGAQLQTFVSKTIAVAGPGDVLGINPNAIVRTEPKSGVSNYEDNGLPYIEFYEEDFLWRYTPAVAAGAADTTRLRPWLALVVLMEEEYILKTGAAGTSFISIAPSLFDQAFHSEKDHWAFGHVHINHKLSALSGAALQAEVNQEVGADPDVAVSRLVCPRKLRKSTGYTAFLIPAFEAGRLAGLGLDTAGVKAQAPSWRKGAMPGSAKRAYDFPVYYQWRFRTASFGDFESLAASLKPVVMEGDTGKMPMDIQQPGFGLTTGTHGTQVIGMEAATKPPEFVPDPWPTNGSTNTDDIAFVNKLRELLNLSADLVDKNAVVTTDNPFFNSPSKEDPLLVPPVYGVWHALISKLGDGTNPAWIEELNLDLRNRGAAGLGAEVIRKHQDEFVNRAWQQVNKVNEANKRIQEAELAKMASNAIFKKHLVNSANDKAVMVTDPVQHLVKVQGNTKTVQQDFIESRVPAAAKSAAFRKITRPDNKVEKASFASVSGNSLMPQSSRIINSNSILQKFNLNEEDGAVTTAKLKRAPDAAISLSTVDTLLQSASQNYTSDVLNLVKDELVSIVQSDVVEQGQTMDKQGYLTAVNNLNASNPGVKPALVTLADAVTNFPLKAVDGVANVVLTDQKYKELFGEDNHAKSYNGVIVKDTSAVPGTDIKPLTTFSDIQSITASFTTFSGNVTQLPQASVAKQFNGVESISESIFDKINPEVSLARKLSATISVWQGGAYVPLTSLKPVMAYPEFTEPVYTYLLELSSNYILPNIDKLLNNSITLLENNQSFIEAFMAGMNHEMARELLWQEYPTDRRGSYFRQFWNIADNIFPADADPAKDKELKLDIKKMNEWTGHLGANSPRAKSANLVLVIRGDLLKKYPNTMVYAQMAEYDPANPANPRRLKGGIDSAQTKFPMFKADLDPDITIFGFDLDEDEAKGERITDPNTPVDGKNPGWFFVLKERPGQLRFGLDDYTTATGDTDTMPTGNPDTWDDLSWEHLVNSKAELDTYHITFTKAITITNSAGQPKWNSNAADLAAILLQDPVLFARHASEMLPG